MMTEKEQWDRLLALLERQVVANEKQAAALVVLARVTAYNSVHGQREADFLEI